MRTPMSLETKCPHCGATYEVAACEINSICKCQICSKSFVVKILPESKSPSNVRKVLVLVSCLAALIIAAYVAYETFQVVCIATGRHIKSEATNTQDIAVQSHTMSCTQNNSVVNFPKDNNFSVQIDGKKWPRYSNTDKCIYIQDPNDPSSLVIAQYWTADFLDRVQYTCFANELRKMDVFREIYKNALAKGVNNPWDDPDKLDRVKISKSDPITCLKSVDSSVWRIVEVEKGTGTNTNSICYIVNASTNPPKILFMPNRITINARSDVGKMFENQDDPLFGEILYHHFYQKIKSKFPDIPILDYQVSTDIIRSFPEKLRESYGILWGKFGGLYDQYLSNLPGVYVESNGLLTRVLVSEKEKHLGIGLKLYSRVGKKLDWNLFSRCFTHKMPLSFETWKTIESETFIFMFGKFITLEGMGGRLGFYATHVETYDLGNDKWINLSE